MSLSLDEYRAKLISKILSAASAEEVKRYIAAAMKAFVQNEVNGHLVIRFLDKMISESAQLNSIKKDSQQWTNIETAKVLLNLVKQKICATAIN